MEKDGVMDRLSSYLLIIGVQKYLQYLDMPFYRYRIATIKLWNPFSHVSFSLSHYRTRLIVTQPSP